MVLRENTKPFVLPIAARLIFATRHVKLAES